MNETIDKLKELLGNDKKIIEENYKEIERLNNIINKAIEYINGICRTIFCDIEYDNAMELLEILKGVDKE